MKNSILLIVLTLFFSMNITGCSLFSSGEEEQETATVSEDGASADDFAETGDDFASDDFESGDNEFDAEAMAKGDGETESFDDFGGEDVEVEDNFADEYPDDDYAKSGAVAGTAEPAAGAEADPFGEDYIDDNSFASGDQDDSLFVDEGAGLPDETMSSNQETDLFAQESADPIVDTPTFADTSYDDGMIYDVPSAPTWVPVKKMKPATYTRAGSNINRLYVVRPGDNMDSIAQKIYGDSSKAKDLYAYNSHFTGKTLNVGDKIYYESPNNPNDQSMTTYYEDNNIPASYYTSKSGDNIRKVSKKLLGHDRSWMEIYATNDSVESKGKIPSGLRLRYWPSGATATMAMNDPEPEAEPAMEEPVATPPPAASVDEPPMDEPVAMDEPEDMPEFDDEGMDSPKEIAANDEPTEIKDPMDEDSAPVPPPTMGQASNTPPPPKPVAPPPPPPAPKPNLRKPAPPKININSGSDDPLAAIGNDNKILGALGGLAILVAFIILVFIRRSRAKRVDFSQTQV